MHLTTSPVDWYAARAAGIAAYLILTLVVCLGMTMASKRPIRRWPRFALEEVHRFGGLLVGSFVVIHVVTIALDAYLPFSIPAIVVPFVAGYRTLYTALGIVAAELLLALAVTNRYRDRLPYAFWRRAHYLNLAVWGAATVHGLGSGTDRSTPWLLALFAASVAAVLGAGAWRARRRPAVSAGLAVAGVAAVVLAALGPLRFSPQPWNASSFDASIAGQVVQNVGSTTGPRLGRRDSRRQATRADPRRPAARAEQARRDLLPARVPAERPALHRQRDQGAVVRLRRALPSA